MVVTVARRPSGVSLTAAAGPARRRGARWVIVGAVLLGYAVQVLWRLWLARHLDAPAAHGDEDGYLIAARVLAGGPGGHSSQNSDFARYGYSLLITPAYWFGWDAFGVYRRVQLLNALLGSATLPLAYHLARRALRLAPGWALGAAALAASLPAVAFYGEFALSDAVCAPLALAWLLALHCWLTGTRPAARWAWAVGAGAAVGYGYTVHVRFTVVAAVHVGVVVLAAVRRLVPARQAATSLAVTALAAPLTRALAGYVGRDLVLDGRSATGHTVHMLTSVGGLSRAVVDGAGQLWSLMIGTWGLGAVGLLAGAGLVLRRLRRPDPAALVTLAGLGATLGVVLLTAAALPPDNRITYHVYPRYVAFLAPYWLLVGVAALVPDPRRRRRPAARAAAWALAPAAAGALLMAALAGLVLVRFHGELAHQWFLAFDAPEGSFLSGRWSRLGLLRASAAADGLLLVAAVGLRVPRLGGYALGALLAVNAVALAQITTRISEPMVVPQYRTGPTLAALGVHEGDLVAVSRRVPWTVRYNDAREVSWAPLQGFDDEVEGPGPTATVVVAPSGFPDPVRDWDGTRWGWYRIGGSTAQSWSVWRRISTG